MNTTGSTSAEMAQEEIPWTSGSQQQKKEKP